MPHSDVSCRSLFYVILLLDRRIQAVALLRFLDPAIESQDDKKDDLNKPILELLFDGQGVQLFT